MVGSHGGHYSRGANPLRGRTLREISRIAGRPGSAAARRIGRSGEGRKPGRRHGTIAPSNIGPPHSRRRPSLFFPRRRALSGRAASPVRRIP
ncbi:hypothetical protein F3J14_04765 [Burkholderia sp. Tr-862]|nr:hypothetical protein [Burkholderia sp. Tr-862]